MRTKLRTMFALVAMCASGALVGCDDSPTLSAGDTNPQQVGDTDATDASDLGPGDDASDIEPGDTSALDTSPPHPALVGTEPGTFTVRPGVEIATVFGAPGKTPITLYDRDGKRLLSVIADEHGQAHFAYIPGEHMTLDATEPIGGEIVNGGTVLLAGDGYVLRDDTQSPPRAIGPFRVLAVDDVPDPALYEGQTLVGVPYGILGNMDGVDPQEGLNYIEVRDGTKLSAMVRFPDPGLWGEGPYPTVIEYSGYSPSDPNAPDPASRIATLLGYATVGVNMRGSGCSGGVFDIFSPAQHADGYDVVEVVARQPWVKGHKVGMVGLSYPGISQLYVAYTNPPSLAAITPMSVLADSWQELRPGGIYNDGFTRQWLEQRDAEAAPNGQSWTEQRIARGDTQCAEHQKLRKQNMEFEELFKALEFYPESAEPRSLPLLVPRIEVPVYLSGAFQDEQTGPQFADMLGAFDAAAVRRFVLSNGRHPDGFSPPVLTRWWEFLELYVAERVPRMEDWIRTLGAAEFSREFDSEGLTFEPDRFAAFAADDYAGVKAAYEAEPEVRVHFEVGGDEGQPGAPIVRYAATFPSWPPPDAGSTTFFVGPGGSLGTTAPPDAGLEQWEHDAAAGNKTFFGPRGYELMARLWDIRWTEYPEGKSLSYLSEPLDAPVIAAGPGFAELWIESDVGDVHVQVTLSEVRPDGDEYLVTSGWLRLGHRELDLDASVGNRVAYTFREDGYEPLASGERVKTRVPIPSVAHVFRAGSRLRMVIGSPGRNHGTWEFTPPDYGGATPSHRLAFGGATPSSLTLSTVSSLAEQPVGTGAPTITNVPSALPPCPGLRGQPCRAYTPSVNVIAP